MINDILKHIKNIELKKLAEDDREITYVIYYNSNKIGLLTINKEYKSIVQKIQQFIELLK